MSEVTERETPSVMTGLRRKDDDGIAVLTFDRPDKRNAMTAPMLRGLITEIEAIAEDDSIRAVVLTGGGGDFCSGADIGELRSSGDARPGTDSDALNAVVPQWWLADCPKPVVAAIDGVAYGLGAELAIQADIRLATPTARLAWNFSRLGLVPDTGAGTALLPRLVGHSTALRLTLSGIPVDGERALKLGLVDELVEPDELLERAIGVARELSSGSRSAIGLIKKLTYDSYGRPAAAHISASTAALNQCFDSPDYQNAVEGFLARRSAASDK